MCLSCGVFVSGIVAWTFKVTTGLSSNLLRWFLMVTSCLGFWVCMCKMTLEAYFYYTRQEFQNTSLFTFCCVFIYCIFWILSSRKHLLSHCWLQVRFHASVAFLCLAAAMFAKLFLVDKHTIIGMFTALKKKYTNNKTYSVSIEVRKIGISKAKIIHKIAVHFKGTSTFCLTILSSLQCLWQILHISLR